MDRIISDARLNCYFLIYESLEINTIDIEFLVEGNTSHDFFIAALYVNNTSQDLIRAWFNALLKQFGVQVE